MLIKCMECGKEVSSKAFACPNCGCPVEAESHGTVRIKFTAQESSSGLNFNQNVSISSSKKLLWRGSAGEVAIIYFENPTEVTVRYHRTQMFFGGETTGIIDPSKSRKYCVFPKSGHLKAELDLQAVEIFSND